MTYSDPSVLVSTDWLADNLQAPDMRVVDASWYLPAMNRNPRMEYAKAHIPGAVYFDIDEIADKDSPYPHALPRPEQFSMQVRKLGLGDGNLIIVYDGAGIFSAPRVWWMFRYFGHRDVAVLDGGMPKWLKEGRSTESLEPMPQERNFTPQVDNTLARNLRQMKQIVERGDRQIVDARSHDRFTGKATEPRPDLPSGHIPGSVNLPFQNLQDPETGTMLPADSLRAAFESVGIDLQKPVITTCGSGISACTLALGLNLLGHKDISVYDGSWSEWAAQKNAAVATGP
ncbi:MAG: 3-mercaptopyruvate sulfurtransferase [Rhodospirillaceae bacterium]|nr:3-mercaptopyruvate sulfurtransferase [Rhodospirillaceae bacterium]